MKRFIFHSVLLFLCLSQLQAQRTIQIEEWNLQFETYEDITPYQPYKASILGWQNNDYALDIEVVQLKNQTEAYQKDVKYGTKEIVEDMELPNLGSGERNPNLKEGYFLLSEDRDTDDTPYPVIVMLVVNREMGLAFEITIDCYSKKKEPGIQMAKSFRLIK